jgi:hypothetical protein
MQARSTNTVSSGIGNSTTGLLSRVNWINFLERKDYSGTYEYPFYSDAHITGEVTNGAGPYTFLNTVPRLNTPGDLAASIVLRVADHLGVYQPDMTKTDESLYHGGSLTDELAALTSLCLGVLLSRDLRRHPLPAPPLRLDC